MSYWPPATVNSDLVMEMCLHRLPSYHGAPCMQQPQPSLAWQLRHPVRNDDAIRHDAITSTLRVSPRGAAHVTHAADAHRCQRSVLSRSSSRSPPFVHVPNPFSHLRLAPSPPLLSRVSFHLPSAPFASPRANARSPQPAPPPSASASAAANRRSSRSTRRKRPRRRSGRAGLQHSGHARI